MSVYVLQVRNATPAVQAQVEAAFRKDPKSFAANIEKNATSLGLQADQFAYTLSMDGVPVGNQAAAPTASPTIHLGPYEIPAANPLVSNFASNYNSGTSASNPVTTDPPAQLSQPAVVPQATGPVPLGTASLYPSGSPQPTDVNQGSLNDCALTSQLAGLAKGNPGLIQSMIAKSPNGGYDVTLYPNGSKTSVHVSEEELASAQTNGGNGKKNWASVIEVATIKTHEDYTVGADPTQVAQLLTGEKSSLVMTSALNNRLDKLQDTLAEGKSVTASASVNTDKVRQHHGYTVLGISGDSVSVRNPLGGAVQTMSKAEFLSSFDAVYI